MWFAMSLKKNSRCCNDHPMTRSTLLTVLLIWAVCSFAVAARDRDNVPSYRYPTYNMAADNQKLYYQSLFVKVMQHSKPEFGDYQIVPVHLPMLQERALVSLNRDIIDVYWTMTSKQREKDYRAIRVPLMQGIIGYRVAIVSKATEEAFKNITTLDDFTHYAAVQGPGWPDTQIMRDAGIRVGIQNSWQNMFLAVEKGYADFFPRSIVEAWAEFEIYGNDNLVIDETQMLYYPAAMYFFVTKDQESLAQRLEIGLQKMIENGEFQKHFNRFPSHRKALSLLSNHKRRIHKMANPFLPEDTPTTDKRLWRTPD